MHKELKETMGKELKEIWRMISQQVENIIKEIENIKWNQTEIVGLKSVTEMKKITRWFLRRFEQVELKISKLKDRSLEGIQSEEEKQKRMKKNE